MKRDALQYSLFALLLAALAIGVNACSKNESSATGAAASAPKETNAPAASAGTPVAAEPSSNPTGEPTVKSAEGAEEVTEQVAETEEGAETKDQPMDKGTAPLKLAQLPPRAPIGSKFKEGVNYMRLSPTQPVAVSPDQVQVTEFFWYGCPHCNALDPRIEAWRNAQSGGKAEYVVFTRVPGTWNDITRFHGRFYFAAESLGRLDELHPLIFNEIHMNGNPLNTVDKAREFFAAHGVDATAFQKNFGALSLERKLDEANTFALRSRIGSVPTFVVNGKYTLDVSSAGGEDQLFALLNELAAREHAKE